MCQRHRAMRMFGDLRGSLKERVHSRPASNLQWLEMKRLSRFTEQQELYRKEFVKIPLCIFSFFHFFIFHQSFVSCCIHNFIKHSLFYLPCVLYNLCDQFPVNHPRLHLLRDGPLDEITVFGGRHRDVDATALAGDDFDHLHTFL